MIETPTIDPYGRRILFALNTLGKHVFAGAESPTERADRRRQERLRRAQASGRDKTGRGLNRAGRRGVLQVERSQVRANHRAALRAA